jgi:hypothetical protein
MPEYLSEQVSRLGLKAQLINIEKPIEAIAGAAQN